MPDSGSEIRLPATPEPFLAWLRGKRPRQRVGDDCRCPLQRFLTEQGAPHAYVGFTIYNAGFGMFPLPEWALQTRRVSDDRPCWGWRSWTAFALLAALEAEGVAESEETR